MQIAAKSMGMPIAEFTKLVESGQLASSEFLPKFAKGLREAANASGALEDKLKTTRVAQGRFFNQLERAQNTIFTSGMDEGGGAMFNDMADAMDDAAQGLKGLGQTFSAVLKTIGGLARILTPVLSGLFNVVGSIASTLEYIFSTNVGKIVLGIGAIKLATMALGNAAGFAAAKFTAIFGVLDEIIALFTTGYAGVTETVLGKDINLNNLPILKDFIELKQEDSALGKLVSVASDILLVLLAVKSALWAMGSKLGILDLLKKINPKGDMDRMRKNREESRRGREREFRRSGRDVRRQPPKTFRSGPTFQPRPKWEFGSKLDSVGGSILSTLWKWKTKIGIGSVVGWKLGSPSATDLILEEARKKQAMAQQNTTTNQVVVEKMESHFHGNPEENMREWKNMWTRELAENYFN